MSVNFISRFSKVLACCSLLVTSAAKSEATPNALGECCAQVTSMLDCINPYYPDQGVAGKAVLSGSTTMQLLGQEWANKFREYHPQVQFTRGAEGSDSALELLKRDPTSIAGVGRMINAQELEALKQSSCKDPAIVIVALEPISIIVHPNNPLAGITPAQLQSIFAKGNRPATWGDVGVTGALANSAVRIHGRGDQSSSKLFIESTLLNGTPAADFAAVHRSTTELLSEVAKDPAAVAIAGIHDLNSVKSLALDINGKMAKPTDDSFMAGEYPLVRPLTLVFDKSLLDHDGGLRREILNYVLSRQGQEEVVRAGFFPINPNFIAQQMASFSKTQLR
jgi:phosphate transport system substrate-binding protein